MSFSYQMEEWLGEDPLGPLSECRRKRVQSGQELLDLSMINPDLAPARYMVDRLLEATMKLSNHRYAVSRGVKKLREAFAYKYKSRFGVKLDADTQISVAMGTKDALSNALLCMANTGDVVLLGGPSYPGHLSACRIAHLRHAFFEMSRDESQMLSSIEQALGKQSARPRILLLNFPNNPTGISVSRSFYEKLLPLCRSRGVFVINDFVYGEMEFSTGPAPSLLSVPGFEDQAIETYSMSKAYCVPGWRVGAVAGSSELIRRFSRLKSHIDYGIFLPIQNAAAAALTTSEDLVSPVVEKYQHRARLLVQGLQRLGWEVSMPGAGATVWAKIPRAMSPEGSLAFALRLLNETGIMLTPGIVFGTEFDEYVRCALVVGEERIHEVLARLDHFMKSREAPLRAEAVG